MLEPDPHVEPWRRWHPDQLDTLRYFELVAVRKLLRKEERDARAGS